jgi:hypothetical protein
MSICVSEVNLVNTVNAVKKCRSHAAGQRLLLPTADEH